MSNNHDERREEGRTEVSLSVSIKQFGVFWKTIEPHASVIDISTQGIGVIAEQPLNEGEEYRFGFSMKWLHDERYVTGRIMYCTEILPAAQNNSSYRIGIRITQDADGTSSFIRTALEEKNHCE